VLPDIDLRIQSIVKTLQDIVLPAVAENEQQAREQVALVMGHLGIIQSQWKVALKFELGTYDGLCNLAREVRALVSDHALQQEIDAALVAATTLDRSDYDAVSREVKRAGAMLDRVIDDKHASRLDPELFAAVLAYGDREAWRNRAWFAGSQIDPGAADLPSIEDLIAKTR
jgi:hypothetical protein